MSNLVLLVVALGVTVTPIVYLARHIIRLKAQEEGWAIAAEALGWHYEKQGKGLPAGARELIPQFVHGPVAHTVSGRYQGISFYLCEIETNPKDRTPTAVFALNILHHGRSLPKFYIRPRDVGDVLKAHLGYTFAPVPDPYNGGVVFLLFEEDALFSDAIGQLPIEFWSGVQDWATHCISDGEWFVYLRRNATVVATAERMPHFVRRALGSYQLLAKHLQPFPEVGNEKGVDKEP